MKPVSGRTMQIERVARALCVSDGKDPNVIIRLVVTNAGPFAPDVPSVAVMQWQDYTTKARAAIEAMREPNEAGGNET